MALALADLTLRVDRLEQFIKLLEEAYSRPVVTSASTVNISGPIAVINDDEVLTSINDDEVVGSRPTSQPARKSGELTKH